MGVRLVNVVWVLLLLAGCSLIGSGGVEIIKPESDSREYRYLELPNQMKVVLISDADTDKAAVSLDVNVGSGADPVDRPGLAHFLEHMLFLGTERYPEAGEYQAFISGKGGSHNAYTSFEHTNYFFDIDSAYLEPAMDRFSQFFVAPLFTERYVEREKNAVHSEYMAKIKDDSRRMFEVLKGAVNPEHPFSKFTVGNLETLAERPGDAVRDQLLAFYEQHYSANLMTLVVHGKESLDELEVMVNARFSEVPNYQRNKRVITEPLFREGALPMQIQLQPEQSKRLLTLMFPLPDVEAYYRSKPLQLISHVVGHEGKGSLLSFLKQQGWAEWLSAGEGVGYRGGSSFSVMVQLTEAGVESRDQVVAAVMQTLQLLRDQGVRRWLFEEERAIAEQNFRFHE